jgi:tetratricopeptide (TPR) repeat protein
VGKRNDESPRRDPTPQTVAAWQIRAETLGLRARDLFDRLSSDPRRYLPEAEELVRAARHTQDTAALALALRTEAWAHRALLNPGHARQLLSEAVRLARRHGSAQVLADVLVGRAAVLQELGLSRSAGRDLREAEGLLTADDAVEQRFQRAVLHQNAGRLSEAAECYRALLERPGVVARIRANSGNNLAIIEAQHGNHQQALRLLRDAAGPAADAGPATVALVANSRAWATVRSGRLAEGLGLFELAQEVYRGADLPLGEHYIEYADALIDLHLVPEAIDVVRRAAAQFSTGGVPLLQAEAELRAARLELLAQRPDQAARAALSARDSFRRQRRGAWAARCELVLGQAQLTRGTAGPQELGRIRSAARRLARLDLPQEAVDGFLLAGRIALELRLGRQAKSALHRAEELSRGGPALVRARGALAAALACRESQDSEQVLKHCRRGLRYLTGHRGELPTAELRARACAHGEELGRLGLQVLVERGTPGRVWQWMERTRAVTLLTEEPADLDRLRRDLELLRSAHVAGSARPGTDPVAPAGDHESTPDDPDTRLRTVEERIRRLTWQLHAGAERRRQVPGAQPMRGLLSGRVLVEYGQLGERWVAVVLEPHRIRLVELRQVGQVETLRKALSFFLRRLADDPPAPVLRRTRAQAEKCLQDLRHRLLDPLDLDPDSELVVVPAGSLHGVPWPALWPRPVSLAPSAAAWAQTRRADLAARPGPYRTAPSRRVALVAGPDLAGGLTEVRRLEESHGAPVQVLGPPLSTVEAVASALGRADLAHLACHGQLRADNPMFSALLLSDGPLTVQELRTRGLSPHRLILAACHSGADINLAGDEVLGFVSALLAGGTAGVVACVSEVPDTAAVALMQRLHRGIREGDTLARALHRARTEEEDGGGAAFVARCAFVAHGAA